MHSKDGVRIVYARPALFQIQNGGWVIRTLIYENDLIELLLHCFISEAKKFTASILVRPLSCETSVCNGIDKTSTAWIAARIFYKWFVCFLICCCFFVLGSHSAVHSHLSHPFFLCIQVVLQGEETVISKQLKVKIGKRKFCKEFHGHHSARGDLKSNLPKAFKDLVRTA